MTKFLTKACTKKHLIKIVGLLAYLTLLTLVVITYDQPGAMQDAPNYITNQPPTIKGLY